MCKRKRKEGNEKLTCMNLYALRKRAELTQGDVAARCGVTIAAYSKWERGTAYPTTDKLPSLAAVFNVTINELFLPYADDLIIPAEGA